VSNCFQSLKYLSEEEQVEVLQTLKESEYLIEMERLFKEKEWKEESEKPQKWECENCG